MSLKPRAWSLMSTDDSWVETSGFKLFQVVVHIITRVKLQLRILRKKLLFKNSISGTRTDP